MKSGYAAEFEAFLFLVSFTRWCERRLCTHLLPRGDKPLDFAELLAAFEEAGLLTAGPRQADARAVWQRVRPVAGLCARAHHRPLLQAVPALPRALKRRHLSLKHFGAELLNNPPLNISAQIISGCRAQISLLQHSDLLFFNR